jgi:hypothetical protein
MFYKDNSTLGRGGPKSKICKKTPSIGVILQGGKSSRQGILIVIAPASAITINVPWRGLFAP